MGDGTTKAIEQVKIGDWVWASDPETGEEGPRQVTDVIVGRGEKKLVEVETCECCGTGELPATHDHAGVTATHDHPFWSATVSAWVDAEHLQPGDELLTAAGETVSVSQVSGHVVPLETVYNLTVDGLHTYYVVVGDQPVLVHNCGVDVGARQGRGSFSFDIGIGARSNLHHTIPRQVRAPRGGGPSQLPPHLASHPDIVGRAGNPTRWDIPEGLHRYIHSSRRPGGNYNARFLEELRELGRRVPDQRSWTVRDITSIRDRLVQEFSISQYRPR
jgi:hypothetical protein